MKSFKKFVQLQEEIYSDYRDLILEAGISRDADYPAGRMVVLKPKKFETFQKKLDDLEPPIKLKVTPETVFTKILPVEDVPVIDLKGGDDSVFLQHGKIIFKLIGTPKAISGYFNHYSEGDGITWGTPQMETAAAIGLYLDGEQMAKDLATKGVEPLQADIDKWKAEVTAVLGNGQDWDKRGVKSIIDGLGKITVFDMGVLAALASGMTSFKNKVVSFASINIIHNKIVDYYNAEMDNAKITTEGEKANTADIIVSNSSISNTLAAVKTEKPTFDKKTGLITAGDVKYYQVSLKKKKGGAQLGKITSAILTRYNISAATLLATILGEEVKYLDEGFMDIVKKAGSFLLDLAKKVFDKLKNVFDKVRQTLTSSAVFQKQASKDAKMWQRILGREIDLSECFDYNGNSMILNEAAKKKKAFIGKKLSAMKNKEKKKLTTTVLIRLAGTEKIFKTSDNLVFSSGGKLNLAPGTADDLYKLFANYVSIEVYNDLIGGGEYTGDQIIKELISLQKEMFFGKTMLPIWKVYGAKKAGDTSTFDFLRSGKEFIDKKTKKLLGKDIRLVGFRANPSKKKKYYTITSSFILGLDDDGKPTYSEVRTGTNTAGAYSFVFEGKNVHSAEKFTKLYK